MTASPQTALISVSDKTGLVELAEAFHHRGIRLLSTGGSAQAIEDAGLPVTRVSDHTGFPEIMGGRVKTLHPNIHGGILGRRGEDESVMAEHGIDGIDWVVVNLYPFAQTVADPDCTWDTAIEHIDIGGPAMVRAAAKNHRDVCVVTDPTDYPDIIAALPDRPALAARKALAIKAFAHTAQYDGQVSQWLASRASDEPMPPIMHLALEQTASLRYGENPHQPAALYRTRGQAGPLGVAGGEQRQGKPLSFNNLLDADAAWSALKLIERASDEAASCVVVKHTNPCGVAVGSDGLAAWEKALACDPTSAFGGIVAVSVAVDAALAEALSERFLEVIIAPAISAEAQAKLAEKPNLRVVLVTEESPPSVDIRAIGGGFLVQQTDQLITDAAALSVVTDRAPSNEERKDLLFAWAAVRALRSNAIVYAKNGQTLGLGVGQMSRIDSANFGVLKSQQAGFDLTGSAMASDAFFPFADSIEAAAQVGVSCIIQPGGSKRDDEVIAAANAAGMAMVFTHHRHFKH